MFDLEKITGKTIDLVAEEKIKNRYFLDRVNQEKIKIYESFKFNKKGLGLDL